MLQGSSHRASTNLVSYQRSVREFPTRSGLSGAETPSIRLPPPTHYPYLMVGLVGIASEERALGSRFESRL